MARFLIILLAGLLATPLSHARGPVLEVDIPPASPLDLVRRLHLRLIERNPSYEEWQVILKEADLDAMTERLLASEEFAETRLRWWTDWLGIEQPEDVEWLRLEIQNDTAPLQRLHDWIAFQQKEPESDHEAFDQLERLSSFLGNEMNCARCHPHPFAETAQIEFVQLAAFLRSDGMVTMPTSIWTHDQAGEVMGAQTPSWWSPRLRISVSNRDIEVYQSGEKAGTRHQARKRFADWILEKQDPPFIEEKLLLNYLLRFFNPDRLISNSVSEHRSLIDDGSLDRWVTLWSESKDSEIDFIRSIASTSEFFRKSDNRGWIAKGSLSESTWRLSVERALDLEAGQLSLLKVNADSFIGRSLLVDEALEQSGKNLDSPSIDDLWLEMLGRRPSNSEAKFATNPPRKELYWALLMSDEFREIP